MRYLLMLPILAACSKGDGGMTVEIVVQSDTETEVTGTGPTGSTDTNTTAPTGPTGTATDTETSTTDTTSPTESYVLDFDPVPAILSRKGEVDEIVLPLPVDLAFPAGAVASWTLTSGPVGSAGMVDGGKFVPDIAVPGSALFTGEYVFTGTLTFADGSAQSVDVPISVIPEEDFQVTATWTVGDMYVIGVNADGSETPAVGEYDFPLASVATLADVTMATETFAVALDREWDSVSCDALVFPGLNAPCDPAIVEVTFWAYGSAQTKQVVMGDYDDHNGAPLELVVVIDPVTGTWTF